MPELMITEFVKEIKEKFVSFSKKLKQSLDFSEVEREVVNACNKFTASFLEEILNDLFRNKDFLTNLRNTAGRSCKKYKEHRNVNISLANGETIKISTPYFLAGGKKIKTSKPVPNGRGSYFGLEILGIIEHCSADYLSDIVQTSLLCPSLEVAKRVLSRRGIEIDVKRLRRLCKVLGELGINNRGEISLAEGEQLKGMTLVIGIDGGRIRERRRKKERKEGQKRDGYYSDWKEPKLFTIYLLDESGKPVKDTAPIYDATMENYQMVFALLENYLMALNVESIDNIVFCGDGDPTIWQNIGKLLTEMSFPGKNIYQVLDYTHAKQNLNHIIELSPAAERINFGKEAKELLWKGDITGIFKLITQTIKSKSRRGQALKKWRNYFQKNEQRMQYTKFRSLNIVCGSGCVESAIRRVINLRLKSAGSFWTKQMAECFLFLRSQLISGRWDIFMKNITNLKRKYVLNQFKSASEDNCQKSGQVIKHDFVKQEENFANAA